MSFEQSEEEVVVGYHESGIELQEGLNTSLSRNYCANCRRKTHCYVTVDRETKEAIINKTCKDDGCKCKCRTHYACKKCGMPHPYGKNCTRMDSANTINPKSIAEINRINEEWRKFQATKQHNMTVKTE